MPSAGIAVPKQRLVEVLQNRSGRALTKGDVVYNVTEDAAPGQFQASVTLVCLGGAAFKGEPSVGVKAAENSAAEQALSAYKSGKINPHGGDGHAVRRPPGAAPAARRRGKDTENPKTSLVVELQAHCGRPLSKSDVIYATTCLGTEFQASVKLMCLVDTPDFLGAPCQSEKEAERAVAQQALLAREVWKAPARTSEAEKRKANEADYTTGMMQLLQKVLGRALTKQDVIYSRLDATDGKFSYSVELRCLQGQVFVGHECATGQLAKHSAAQVALNALTAPGADATAPPPPPYSSGKRQKTGQPAEIPPPKRLPEPPPKPPLEPRKNIGEAELTGEVLEWDRRGWGWIRPHGDIPSLTNLWHSLGAPPGADGSRLYVRRKDLSKVDSLYAGCLVQFRVYADARGLGAQQVEVF